MITPMNEPATSIVPESLRCEAMTVESPHFDEATAALTLGFRFDDDAPIEETIVFPGPPLSLTEAQRETINRLAAVLSAVASTSYYKARLPETVRVQGPIGEAGQALVRSVFQHGLAEFACRNGLEPIEPTFEFAPSPETPPSTLPEATDWLVAIGGGKDSVVATELLKQAGQSATAACVGSYEPVRECAAIAGLELVEIERHLAPQLAEWNALGAPNGHVPVTAIHSLILLIQAVLSGKRAVVMANERSADEPTRVEDDGTEVNHQYSKSFAFEQALRAWLHDEVGTTPDYFSILRPLSELEVCRRFAGMPEYHAAFVSCNAAYRRDPEHRASRWCGDCPKCRFVFLGLAPFMRAEDLTEIFGRDLLSDDSQLTGFLDLLSPETKPFECVGTRAEVRAAFGLLRADVHRRESPVVRQACEAFGITPYRIEHAKAILSPSGAHEIPDELASKLGF
jgi:UDP-N-acetyl-alpha-D-muramoyl-L-alanyl-L-glutamate epimerase